MTSTIRGAFATTVAFLNSPVIKEGIKNISGVVSFAFGFYTIFTELNDLYKNWNKQRVITPWNAAKIVLSITKVSLVFSAIASRPGIWICSKIGSQLISEQTSLKAFGPNTIFAINWKHPRHGVSIVAAILSVPGTIVALHHTCISLYNRVKVHPQEKINPVYPMATFNFVFSRPFIHTAHAACRALLRR